MMKKLTLAGAAFVMGATSLIPATPVMAQRYYDGYSQVDRYGNPYRQYRGRNQNYHRNYRRAQKCRDGDGGTIVGALAGGLAGNALAGRGGDRTLGTILGGVVGAVAGRSIDRADRPNYCR
jgi:uncharacterized protein YcfJ